MAGALSPAKASGPYDGTIVAGQSDVPMLFRQLFDKESSTYTYLIADEVTKEAALVDTVLEELERDLEIVNLDGGMGAYAEAGLPVER